MFSQQNDKNNNTNILQEPDAGYEKAEMDLLKDALNRSYSERFKRMTALMKMNIMFRNAKIEHKPFINPSVKP